MNEFKLVPAEPTEAMIDAARDIHEGERYLPTILYTDIYKAMLAAAPAVQGEPDVARHDAMRFALSEMVKWYENISLGNNPAFQYYNLAKKALLSAAPQPAAQQLRKDSERLDWIESQAKKSPTGISFDYHKYVEDGYVLEHGFRFMRRHFASGFKDNIRKAIDAAMQEPSHDNQ